MANELTSNGFPLKVSTAQDDDGTDTALMRDAVVRAALALLPPEQIADVAADRVIIEQAKGMLMMIYAIDADQAFELLTSRSKQASLQLRTLARLLTHAFPKLYAELNVPSRAEYDEVLLTAAQCLPAARE